LVSPAQGVVTLAAKAGDAVKTGDVMARIVSPELENQLNQERSTLLSMQSELDRLRIANRQTHLQNQQEVALLEVRLVANERAMERARQLFEEGLGSSIDFEKARDDVKVVRLELAHAEQKTQLEKETMDFDLRTKELELERQQLVVRDVERKVEELDVISPVNGLVAVVDVRDKDTVQPNQVLLSVVDLSEFEIEILIPENYADEVGIGTSASMQYEGSEYPCEVRSLSPEVEDSQVKGRAVFSGQGPEGLKENQRVFTRLLLESKSDVLKAPRGPFLESLGGRQVYLVRNGVAQLHPIKVGSVSVTEVEIESGLQEGDRIVLSDLTRFEGANTLLLRD
jgi:HlyD family secretion protein